MATKSLRQLLEEPVHTVPYLVRPILPVGGKLFLYAPKKHQKSLALFNIAYDLSEGLPVLGQETWTPARPFTVQIFEQELGEFRCKSRFNRIHSARGGPTAMDNIYITSKNRGIRLDSDHGIAALHREVEMVKPDVVVLDPIRKFHRQDENDSTAMTKVIDVMDKLIERHGVTLLVAHHEGRDNPQFPNAKHHMRGSTVFHDEADTAMHISKPVKNDPNRLRFTVEDLRDDAIPEPFDMRFDPDTYTFAVEVA